MGYTYTSTEDGQTITASAEIDYLEGLARWVRTGEPDDEGNAPKALEAVLTVSSPSGTPEESASGGPFPTGKPDPRYDVNVPSPDTVDSPEAVLVKAPNPDPNFDAGDGRKSDPVDLLGVNPDKIVNQANDAPVVVTVEDAIKAGLIDQAGLTEVDGINEADNKSGVDPEDPAHTSAGEGLLERPAANGKTEDWLAFARQSNLEVADDASRADLIAAVEAHDAEVAGQTAATGDGDNGGNA